MKRTELHQAFIWTCDNCGRDQFERAISVEVSEQDERKLKFMAGVELWWEGRFIAAPTEVTCQECDHTYSTEEP